MEPFEGPLRAAEELLESANRVFGKVAPRSVFDLAHGAIHSFVEAASKSRGVRGKIGHAEVWRRAQEMGFPGDLVDAVKTVEGRRGIVYGAVVTEEDARRALETANRLARLVRVTSGAPQRLASRPSRSGGRRREAAKPPQRASLATASQAAAPASAVRGRAGRERVPAPGGRAVARKQGPRLTKSRPN